LHSERLSPPQPAIASSNGASSAETTMSRMGRTYTEP
jgi:hypothetical protein